MRSSVLFLLLLASTLFAAQPRPGFTDMAYITNGHIRLGVDLSLGGTITHLSAPDGPNIINSHDWGRQIQMSHYSGPVPFTPNGKQPHKAWKHLGWNPIQTGDCYGNRSRLLEQRVTATSIYTKSIPMQWPLNNVPGDCTFETWIELADDAPVARVRCRTTNARADLTQYPGRHQEVPAIYTNGPWWKLLTYTGDKPFTNAPLTQRPATAPWTGWRSPESFAALVNDADVGLGIWAPGVHEFIGGFAGKPGKGGEKDPPTGYIAPIHTDILDHNIVYEYQYHLILGHIDEIHRYVYAQPRPTLPDWTFAADRQHWIYLQATDAGWPITGELHITSTGEDPQLLSPYTFWNAEAAPTLRIEVATNASELSIFWQPFTAPGFTAENRTTIRLIPDGQYHSYSIPLSKSPNYKGPQTRLRLDPPKGTTFRLRRVQLR